MKKAIYLSGGGARAAYQAGVLQGIQEIIKAKQLPVEVLSSVSAGSINAAFLAMHADDFAFAVTRLVELWSSICCDKVYRTSSFSLLQSVLRNVLSMTFRYPIKKSSYLLDTAPLKELLTANLNFKQINDNIRKGLVKGFEVAAFCYDYPETVAFFHSTDQLSLWHKAKYIACPTEIQCHHILASSAMPLYFPPIKIENLHYGDGGMRHILPLRSAITLGAERILVISTNQRFASQMPTEMPGIEMITFAKILGDMLNALFLDTLDRDIELILKINQIIDQISVENRTVIGWKKIDILAIRPSKNLEELAEKNLQAFPFFLRYLMSVFGAKKQSGKLLSFLLFEEAYCKELVKIGYDDAMAQKDEIKNFFSE